MLDVIEPLPCDASSQPKCPRGERVPTEAIKYKKIAKKKKTFRDKMRRIYSILAHKCYYAGALHCSCAYFL